MDDMNMNMLLQKFHNVSRQEFDKLRQTILFHGSSDNESSDNEAAIKLTIESFHNRRENKKINGKESMRVGPLVHVLSVHVLPHQIDHQQPIIVYGKIYSEFCDTSSGKTIKHNLYRRKCDNPQILGPSGSLALTDLENASWSQICMPLHNTKLVVDVSLGGQQRTLAAAPYVICCVEDMSDFEQVKQEHISTDLGVLALRYITIPFGVYGKVEVQFYHKHGCEREDHRFLNVKGKIVARYGNSYGGSSSEECTLFEKHSNEFEQVKLDLRARNLMRLSRCWVALPVYSSIILDLDLFEFGTERKIVKETVEFQVENKDISYADYFVDDLHIEVDVNWLSPLPQGHMKKDCDMELEDESSDHDHEMSMQGASKDDSDDEQMNEPYVPESSSNTRHPWQLRAHRNKLFPSPAVEIFSIFIGREVFKTLQVYGFVEVSCVDGCTIYGFNREAKDAFRLLEDNKTLPVLNGFLAYDDCDSLEMKIDLKDVEGHLYIRGHVDDWDNRTLELDTKWLNAQLCSVVAGERGFAAIHYSIFPEAVKANVGVICSPKQKNGNGDDVSFKIYGSIVAQYDNFDYTSRHAKDYYRVVLFERNQEDPTQTSGNGVISLSRSIIIVPLSSRLVIKVNMCIADDQVILKGTTVVPIETNEKQMVIESSNYSYSLGINVKWVEI